MVEFVDTQSYLYAKNKQMCEFWIRGTTHGELESPRHSLPPNTTCLYHLQVSQYEFILNLLCIVSTREVNGLKFFLSTHSFLTNHLCWNTLA